ncbi:MAG: glycosyltransferase family 39 protein, partial [Candidatus Aenigmarchaeota archaeon]|nr:glycosyltransferase family 39 protein [Candidatus Aenigmarchaeota archaeon]
MRFSTSSLLKIRNRRECALILSILIIGLVIRVLGINSMPFFDEISWIFAVETSMVGGIGEYVNFIPHPPLAFVLYYIFASLIGLNFIAFHLMPLMIGLSTILVTYYLAKSLYDRETAILSAFLMSVTFYCVWMSLFIDMDGNILTLLSILVLYFFNKFAKTGEKKYLMMTGCLFGLSVLSKYSAFLLLPSLILYDFFVHRFKNLKSIALIAFIGSCVFSVFPMLSFVSGSPQIFTKTLV